MPITLHQLLSTALAGAFPFTFLAASATFRTYYTNFFLVPDKMLSELRFQDFIFPTLVALDAPRMLEISMDNSVCP
jgi:hypothetical protein